MTLSPQILRKFFSWVLTVVIASVGLTSPATAVGCTLNQVNGVYQLGTYADMQQIAPCALIDKDFELYQDIDMTGISAAPLPTLSANIDGNDHEISGISLSVTSGSYAGFWEQTYMASISDLTMSGSMYSSVSLGGFVAASLIHTSVTNLTLNIDVEGTAWVGGVTSQANWSTLTNVEVNPLNELSDIRSSSGYLGGVAAYSNESIFDRVGANIDVIALTDSMYGIGGLVGSTQTTASAFYDVEYHGTIQSGGTYVGGILGFSQNLSTITTIDGATVSGEINAKDSVGGIVGLGYKFTITEAISTATIKAKMFAGGLVGLWYGYSGAEISKSAFIGRLEYSAAVPESSGSAMGGLVGLANLGSYSASVTDSFAIADIQANYSVGGIFGDVRTATGTMDLHRVYSSSKLPLVEYSWSDMAHPISGGTTNPQTVIDFDDVIYDNEAYSLAIDSYPVISELQAKSTTDLTKSSTYANLGWDFTNTWELDENKLSGLPSLRSIATYPAIDVEIDSCELELDGDIYWVTDWNDLQAIANCDAEPGQQKFYLANDISLDAMEISPLPEFTGYLSGNGHEITGIYLDTPTADGNLGLFESLNGAVIYNIQIRGTVVGAADKVGLLAAKSNNTTFWIVAAYTTIQSLASSAITGGLVGEAVASSFTNVFVDDPGTTQIVASGGPLGGVVGTSLNNKFEDVSVGIDNVSSLGLDPNTFVGGVTGKELGNTSYTDMTIYASVSNSQEIGKTGGMVGLMLYTGLTPSVIEDSVFSGSVTGVSYVGGLVGMAYGLQIQNTRVTGNVVNQQDSAGGLVGYWQAGYLLPEDSIEQSFFDGLIGPQNGYSNLNTGGLVGSVNATNGNATLLIKDSFSFGSNSGSNQIGGITGVVYAENHVGIEIQDSYTSMYCPNVTSVEADSADPLFGAIQSSSLADVENVYWDKTKCGVAVSSPIGDSSGVFSKNLQRAKFLQESDWDRTNIWMQDLEQFGGMPILRGVGGLPENPTSPLPTCQAVSLKTLYFATNSAALSANVKARLNSYATMVEDSNCLTIMVSGYASKMEKKKGKSATVWQKTLSANRAKAIQNYLLARFATNQIQVTVLTRSYGAKKPVVKETSKSNIAKNRRATFVVSN